MDLGEDIHTEGYLRNIGLTERQIRERYICGVKKGQATDGLPGLEEKGIFDRVGVTGKRYLLCVRGAPQGCKRGERAPEKKATLSEVKGLACYCKNTTHPSSRANQTWP